METSRAERSRRISAPEVSSRSPAAPLSERVRMPARKGISSSGASSQIVGKNIAYALDNTHADGMLWGEVGRSGVFSQFRIGAHACLPVGRPAGSEQAHISTAGAPSRRAKPTL